MTELSDTYFQIKDATNFVRIEPLRLAHANSELDWDRNWIETRIIVKSNSFNGQFVAYFMTTDFELFKREIKNLNDKFDGVANLNPIESQLTLKIVGDGLGHFTVNCKASGDTSLDEVLSFTLNFDQTDLRTLTTQLENITKKFPINGDFKIKNI